MKRLALASLSLAALSLAGCGGSGGATETASAPSGSAARAEASSSPAEPNAAVAATAPFTPIGLVLTGTDSATPTWGHVWAMVHKVEGVGADDKPVTLFTSGEGFLVDLTTPTALPGAGVLASNLAPLTRLRVTLAPSLQVVKPGQASAETVALVPALPKDAEGRAVATLTLPKPFEGKSPLALAAVLSQLVAQDGKAGLNLTVAESPKDALTLTVAGVIRGTQLFVAGGGRLELKSDASTVLTNADGSPSPRSADGTRATVSGRISLDGKTVTAHRISLGPAENAQLEGEVGEVDSTLGSFTLTASRVSGILPTRLSATITLAEKPVLRGRGGLVLSREAFLAALSEKGTTLRVEGVYEPVAGSFTARRAQLLGGSAHEVRLSGVVTLDEKSKTLTLSKPTEWDGFAPGEKDTAISTTSATAYFDLKGAELTRDAFVAALAEHSVQVVGLLNPEGKLTATRLTLAAAPPKPEPEKKAEAPAKKAPPTEDPKKI